VGTPRHPPARAWVAVGVVASTLAAAALLSPWVALGSRRFSSLDLISSASALELVEGRRKLMVLAAWMIVPVFTAASYVLAALGRWRLWACALLPIGPTYALGLVATASRSPLRTQWGLHLGTAAGATATLVGVVLLVGARARRRHC